MTNDFKGTPKAGDLAMQRTLANHPNGVFGPCSDPLCQCNAEARMRRFREQFMADAKTRMSPEHLARQETWERRLAHEARGLDLILEAMRPPR